MSDTLGTKRQRNTISQGLTSELKERANKYAFLDINREFTTLRKTNLQAKNT